MRIFEKGDRVWFRRDRDRERRPPRLATVVRASHVLVEIQLDEGGGVDHKILAREYEVWPLSAVELLAELA